MKLPTQANDLFWDIDFSKLNYSKNASFIIKRVLDRGNVKTVNWLLKKFTKNEIKKTILTSRDISQKTANLWADIYKLNKLKIICLQKPYSPIQFGLSS